MKKVKYKPKRKSWTLIFNGIVASIASTIGLFAETAAEYGISIKATINELLIQSLGVTTSQAAAISIAILAIINIALRFKTNSAISIKSKG